MPKGRGYSRKKGRNSKGRKSPIRKTMRKSKPGGKKIFYVGGYQA